MPAVTRMSLCAIGMPVSGPPVPAAIAASAALASASARSGSTVMKALSAGLRAAIRSSEPRVSSTLDTRREWSADASSTMEASITAGSSCKRLYVPPNGAARRSPQGASALGRPGACVFPRTALRAAPPGGECLGTARRLCVPPERRCAPLPPGGECLGTARRHSFEHLRYQVQPVLHRRRDALVDAPRGPARRRRRVATGAPRPAHAPSAATPVVSTAASSSIRPKIAASLRAHFFGVRGVDFDAREVRDPVNVGERDGHGGRRADREGVLPAGRAAPDPRPAEHADRARGAVPETPETPENPAQNQRWSNAQ